MNDADFRPALSAIQRAAARLRLPLAEVRSYAPDCVRDVLAAVRVLDADANWHELTAHDRVAGKLDFELWTFIPPRVRGFLVIDDTPDCHIASPSDDPIASLFFGFLQPADLEIDAVSLAEGCALFHRERQGKRRRRGRPPEHDMIGLAIEANGWIHANGRPKPQSQLVKYLLDWSAQRSNRLPDEREVQRLVAAIVEAIDRHAGISPISPRGGR